MKQVDLPSGMTLKDLVRDKHEGEAHESLEMDMGPIHEALEDQAIPLDESPVSRVRLINALMRKFGQGFKAVPAAKKALDHYDKEAAILRVIKFNRRKFHGSGA